MSHYSDAELRQIRILDQLVRAELQRQGLPILNDRPIDEILASGAFTAAECLVRSKDLVTPGWSAGAPSGRNETP